MFGRKTPENIETNPKPPVAEPVMNVGSEPKASPSKSSNTLLRGSKLIGDIHVICDLELSGDVVGNIFSKEKSNITIKGSCKGNIETGAGTVSIDGELLGGNITTGLDVRITGKFFGGEVKAKGKVYVNGEFSGKIEANEIELGPNAKGQGEFVYKEAISIARGAQVEVKISKNERDVKLVSAPSDESESRVAASNVLQLGR